MPPRTTISNFVITLVIVFFLFILGLLLKARYRLPSEEKAAEVAQDSVPHAIPVAVAVEPKIAEPRAYKSGAFWVLPHPELVISRANGPDTLRIRSGPKEDIFVLYGVDCAQMSWTHAQRLGQQVAFFGGAPASRILETGTRALNWVTQLLSTHPFIVYTQWTRVPETERFYALIRVELEPGKQEDLGELLVRRGYAAPQGTVPTSMPEAGRTVVGYQREIGKALSQAKAERSGLWDQ